MHLQLMYSSTTFAVGEKHQQRLKFNFTNTAATDNNGNIVSAMSFEANKNGGGVIHAGIMMGNKGGNEGQNVVSIGHELFHGLQHEYGQGGASILSEIQATLFASNLASSLGYNTESFGNNSIAGQAYDNVMNELSYQNKWNSFSAMRLGQALGSFKNGSNQNSTNLYNNFPLYKKNQTTKPIIKKFFPLFRPEGGPIIKAVIKK